MKNYDIENAMFETMKDFRLPRYSQLPDMGLYLEQTAKYINQCLSALGSDEITGSMIRNYVKMGLVPNPVQKQYYAHHISYLMVVAILKRVMSLEHINKLFERKREHYSASVAYDYFCDEMENILYFRFGIKDTVDDIGGKNTIDKEMLRSAIIAVSHIIHVDVCFAIIEES